MLSGVLFMKRKIFSPQKIGAAVLLKKGLMK